MIVRLMDPPGLCLVDSLLHVQRVCFARREGMQYVRCTVHVYSLQLEQELKSERSRRLSWRRCPPTPPLRSWILALTMGSKIFNSGIDLRLVMYSRGAIAYSLFTGGGGGFLRCVLYVHAVP